jgi:hypothetical protein
LERVDDPDFIRNLDNVNNAERIAAERETDFEHAGAEAMHGLCDIRFPAFRRDRKRREKNRLGIRGKGFKIP